MLIVKLKDKSEIKCDSIKIRNDIIQVNKGDKIIETLQTNEVDLILEAPIVDRSKMKWYVPSDITELDNYTEEDEE